MTYELDVLHRNQIKYIPLLSRYYLISHSNCSSTFENTNHETMSTMPHCDHSKTSQK